MPKHFTKGSQLKFTTLSLAALAISLNIICLNSMPAHAQDIGPSNTDLEVFGGGIVKTHSQGFDVGQGYSGVPGAGSVTIKRNALEQVSWYQSRRQISIENDGPIVNYRGGGQVSAAVGPQGGLTPATFGGSCPMSGAIGARHNLTPAQFGPKTRPQASQARPIMHACQAGSQGNRAASNALAATAPPQQQPPPRATSYGGYGGGQNVSAAADSEAARIREVKARLLLR